MIDYTIEKLTPKNYPGFNIAILLLDPLVERNSFYSITHSPDAIK